MKCCHYCKQPFKMLTKYYYVYYICFNCARILRSSNEMIDIMQEVTDEDHDFARAKRG